MALKRDTMNLERKKVIIMENIRNYILNYRRFGRRHQKQRQIWTRFELNFK